MTTTRFRFVSTDRRVREDRRFVVGKGRFAADIAAAGTRHVALVTCPHPVARYAGEWVAAVVAETRALAEDAAELVRVHYEPLPFVLDGETAYAPGSPIVHADHGSNVLIDRTFVWGEGEKDFAESPHHLSLRLRWGRSSTVPIETFAVLANWDPWRELLDVYASVQMPRFPDQVALALKLPGSAVRVHNDVDVGGSYGVKRGIKHAVLVGYLSRRLGFPVRLVEDRLENMRGGDGHGPERNFDVEVAFDHSGVIRSMKMRALDNVGAYAGRSPFQLGKPIGAIVGPYRINSVQYRAIAVTSNKTVQEAVRAFGQSPTNYAIERAIEEVARHRGLDRLEVRRRNLIRAEQFPYLIPSGTTYDSGDYHAVIDKVIARANYAGLLAERDRLRRQDVLAGIGMAACLEPSGANSTFEPLLNPKNETTTYSDSCRINVDLSGAVTATIHTLSAGQGHETLVATVIGEVLEIDPDRIRVVRPDSLSSLPSQSPVGSRMAIMLGGAAFHAAQKLKARLVAIAAHDLKIPLERATYDAGHVFDRVALQNRRSWAELVTIAHRHFHRLPPDTEPGLAFTHVMQVPTGGQLPTADGRVQMYPCFAFEFHLLLIAIDPDLGNPEIKRYFVVADEVALDLWVAEIGIDRDQQEMELEGEARIHLHAAVGGRQLPPGRHLHDVREGKPRLGVGRQPVEMAMGDGHELGPAPPVLQRDAIEHVAGIIGRALQWNLEVMGGDGDKTGFELLRGVKRGAAQHDRHAASDRALARQR